MPFLVGLRAAEQIPVRPVHACEAHPLGSREELAGASHEDRKVADASGSIFKTTEQEV